MRTSTAFLAGAATVVVAIVAGVGGGLLMANIVSPHTPRQGIEMSRLERRMSSEPIAASPGGPTQPVPYLAETQAPPLTAAVPAQPTASQQTSPQAASADSSTGSPEKSRDVANQSPQEAAKGEPVGQPVPEHVARSERDKVAQPQDALARARDAEVRRSAERRRGERHQQWADRRRGDPRQDVQRRMPELRDVEERVRQDSEPRFFQVEPIDSPRVRFFGAGDD
ncbi:hypothetical protein [Bradyrhizobium sp. NP1]|uniref:hypothetical protein n=1 Tax=Bradyrhizobium sp. NP1 TaxID=3049772 RepID=UPI0025A5B6E8|nr:hypothetical protein [Bradyrhizobium sp. NP1]WJR79120.1 hypothetical protein QOU61_04805 [Bradyrhizobium sp. NP1]